LPLIIVLLVYWMFAQVLNLSSMNIVAGIILMVYGCCNLYLGLISVAHHTIGERAKVDNSIYYFPEKIDVMRFIK
jgi:predicted membrane channel-forming protein YqfA (hemolysin III family)